MSKKVKDGDHVVVGERIDESASRAFVFCEGGEVTAGIVTTDRERLQESFQLEPCPGSPGGVFHVCTTGHRGPARVNNKEYCEGWDRIFGKRGNHTVH